MHEFVASAEGLKKSKGITAMNLAKRLLDYGFHAPTVYFPLVVPEAMMIEPTESESLEEMDRFCEAMLSIRAEIRKVETGEWDPENNPLRNAPHTPQDMAGDWDHPYSREEAAYPAPWTKRHKFWPPVSRVDNGYGDRNLVCTCPPTDAYADDEAGAAVTSDAPRADAPRPAGTEGVLAG